MAPEDAGLEVVVEDRPRDPQGREGVQVAVEEVLHIAGEDELEILRAREAQREQEGPERLPA
jgi:hypothetical protein